MLLMALALPVPSAGLLWSVAGAFTQSGIDVLRKHGSNVRKIAPNDLVALVTLFDASLASAGFVLTEGPGLFAAGGALSSTLEHPTRYGCAHAAHGSAVQPPS